MAPGDRKQGEIFRDVEPEDQLKYGLIAEFAVSLPEQRFF
jgi:ATP-dependent Clp protease ATP-binding subunit ClpX